MLAAAFSSACSLQQHLWRRMGAFLSDLVRTLFDEFDPAAGHAVCCLARDWLHSAQSLAN
jgi:hypothetical protein